MFLSGVFQCIHASVDFRATLACFSHASARATRASFSSSSEGTPALLREHQSFSKPELLGLLKVAHDYTTSRRQHC